ncbi:MAG: DegV family protein [Clostridia bacterium]|nr:DegV family protein [Clostridia bacterium]
MKIALSTESTCDLSNELIKTNRVSVIPYTIILGDEEVVDGEGIPQRIFEFVERTKKLPKTSAINEDVYAEYFEKLLKTHDAVVHITLSGGITSSVEHAEAAAKRVKNVFVVDSKSLSTGIGLLVLYARKLIDAGHTAKEVADMVQARVPFVQASFVVERLDYLYKGGRCNAIALLGANLLRLRPQIKLVDGKMKPAKKYRGKMNKVIAEYTKDTIEEFNNPDKSVAFITYTTATPEMIEAAKTALVAAGFETIYETTAGGTITSHCGEHVLGVLYINDGGNK